MNSKQEVSGKELSRFGGTRSERRRRKIFRSLHDCMIQQGFVRTALADIAEGADMSASHLLYYFNGKEDILEQYFERVSERFLERIEEISSYSPEEQIDLLADWWFKSETSTINEIGFMLECFGAAVHDEVLKITKAEFDSQCKAYLCKIFENAPELALGNAVDSAEVAYSMMIGLRSAVYFDDSITLDHAHRLFANTFRKMCRYE